MHSYFEDHSDIEKISLSEVAKAMGITKNELARIRKPSSRYYLADFPKSLPRTGLMTYLNRSEFDTYLTKITAMADYGKDPLAPRPLNNKKDQSKQMEIPTESVSTIAMREIMRRMGISRSTLRGMRDPASTLYQPRFPKPLQRPGLKLLFDRAEVCKYLLDNEAIRATGIDPLARRMRKSVGKRTTSHTDPQEVEVLLPVIPKYLSPSMIENIRNNVLFSLFGNDFFDYMALKEAVRMSGIARDPDISAQLGFFHGRMWATVSKSNKVFILSTIRDIFSTAEGEDFQEWKGSICSELSVILELMDSKKNFVVKWWERRKPKNAQYKLFLKNS